MVDIGLLIFFILEQCRVLNISSLSKNFQTQPTMKPEYTAVSTYRFLPSQLSRKTTSAEPAVAPEDERYQEDTGTMETSFVGGGHEEIFGGYYCLQCLYNTPKKTVITKYIKRNKIT